MGESVRVGSIDEPHVLYRMDKTLAAIVRLMIIVKAAVLSDEMVDALMRLDVIDAQDVSCRARLSIAQSR